MGRVKGKLLSEYISTDYFEDSHEFLRALAASIVDVKLEQKSMKDQREQKAGDTNQGKPAIESVKSTSRFFFRRRCAHPAPKRAASSADNFRCDPNPPDDTIISRHSARSCMLTSTTTPVVTLSEAPKCYRPIASNLELDLAFTCAV